LSLGLSVRDRIARISSLSVSRKRKARGLNTGRGRREQREEDADVTEECAAKRRADRRAQIIHANAAAEGEKSELIACYFHHHGCILRATATPSPRFILRDYLRTTYARRVHKTMRFSSRPSAWATSFACACTQNWNSSGSSCHSHCCASERERAAFVVERPRF